MKALASILAVLAAVFAYLYWQEMGTARELKAKNATLTAQTNKDLDASKITCSQRATALFRSLGYSDNDKPTADVEGAIYRDHYNPALRRCLIVVETTSNVGKLALANGILSDVDERTQLGDYGVVFHGDTGQKQVLRCAIEPPGKPETQCGSQEQWEADVKSLMN
jgi:hypothetical protein